MSQVLFAAATAPSLVSLDANFAGLFSLRELVSDPGYTAAVPRMTLDASGRLGVGTTTPTANLVVAGVGGSGWFSGTRNTLLLYNNNVTSNQSSIIAFASAGSGSCFIANDLAANGSTNQLNIQAGASGGVYLANTATSWTAVSDERAKDIIEHIADAPAKVATLRAVIGKYKNDEVGKRRAFLIAQDVQAVLPEAVDATNPDSLGVQYSDVIPLLVAAITEHQTAILAFQADGSAKQAQIDTLLARVAVLEAR